MTLKDRRVLVTGAGGFIGSHLVERLIAEGARVRALCEYDPTGSWGWLALLRLGAPQRWCRHWRTVFTRGARGQRQEQPRGIRPAVTHQAVGNETSRRRQRQLVPQSRGADAGPPDLERAIEQGLHGRAVERDQAQAQGSDESPADVGATVG